MLANITNSNKISNISHETRNRQWYLTLIYSPSPLWCVKNTARFYAPKTKRSRGFKICNYFISQKNASLGHSKEKSQILQLKPHQKNAKIKRARLDIPPTTFPQHGIHVCALSKRRQSNIDTPLLPPQRNLSSLFNNSTS